jgi:hypothetical protein
MPRAVVAFACSALLIPALVMACKSDSTSEPTDAGSYTPGDSTFVQPDAGFLGITATVDGMPVSFIEQRNAYASSAGELTTIKAFLLKGPTNTGPNIVLTIDAEKAGRYDCAVPGATLAYTKDDGSSYGAIATNADGGSEGSCKIEITSYAANVGELIEGTFEGTLYRFVGTGGPQTVTVTNGRFRIPRTTDE